METASRFQDQAVPDVFLDLSKVRFILTANDQAQIPAPLLDRVRTFEIEPPSAEGMRKIAQRIFESLLFEYDLELSPVLPAAVLDDSPGLGPRKLKTRLEAAIAIAILDNQSELNLASWRQTDCSWLIKTRSMGFL